MKNNKIIGIIVCLIGVALMLYSMISSPEVPSKEDVYVQLQDGKVESVLNDFKEYTQEDIKEAWGKADSMLSGMYGDIYEVNDKEMIIIYYSAEDDNVEDIKLALIERD